MRYYFAAAAFGVASTFYVLRPVLDEFEKRRKQTEIQAAVEAIEKAN